MAARQKAHLDFLTSLLEQLERDLGRAAGSHGTEAGAAWSRLLAEAKKPPPMPCLSPCRMPSVTDIQVNVPFNNNDAELREGDRSVAQALDDALRKQRGHGSKATLVVRGHADPSENRGDELATKRARAVADWLIAKGIAAADVKVVSMGSHLRLERAGGTGADRRVDFEVVPR